MSYRWWSQNKSNTFLKREKEVFLKMLIQYRNGLWVAPKNIIGPDTIDQTTFLQAETLISWLYVNS